MLEDSQNARWTHLRVDGCAMPLSAATAFLGASLVPVPSWPRDVRVRGAVPLAEVIVKLATPSARDRDVTQVRRVTLGQLVMDIGEHLDSTRCVDTCFSKALQ